MKDGTTICVHGTPTDERCEVCELDIATPAPVTAEPAGEEEAKEYAEKYANCRNGKQVGVNFTEWQRSHDGALDGALWGLRRGKELAKAAPPVSPEPTVADQSAEEIREWKLDVERHTKHSMLCVLEEVCLREPDADGPFVILSPENKPCAVHIGETNLRLIFRRLRDEFRRRYGEAYQWRDKRLEENEAELSTLRSRLAEVDKALVERNREAVPQAPARPCRERRKEMSRGKCKYGHNLDGCELGHPGCLCADDMLNRMLDEMDAPPQQPSGTAEESEAEQAIRALSLAHEDAAHWKAVAEGAKREMAATHLRMNEAEAERDSLRATISEQATRITDLFDENASLRQQLAEAQRKGEAQVSEISVLKGQLAEAQKAHEADAVLTGRRAMELAGEIHAAREEAQRLREALEKIAFGSVTYKIEGGFNQRNRTREEMESVARAALSQPEKPAPSGEEKR